MAEKKEMKIIFFFFFLLYGKCIFYLKYIFCQKNSSFQKLFFLRLFILDNCQILLSDIG